MHRPPTMTKTIIAAVLAVSSLAALGCGGTDSAAPSTDTTLADGPSLKGRYTGSWFLVTGAVLEVDIDTDVGTIVAGKFAVREKVGGNAGFVTSWGKFSGGRTGDTIEGKMTDVTTPFEGTQKGEGKGTLRATKKGDVLTMNLGLIVGNNPPIPVPNVKLTPSQDEGKSFAVPTEADKDHFAKILEAKAKAKAAAAAAAKNKAAAAAQPKN
jgi:hypothetical protein